MKIAFLNDTHADFGGAQVDVFIRYQRKFYSEVFFPYCEKHGIKKIIHLGDYYHNKKTASYKAIYENRKMFLEKLVEKDMSMDIIPGNHDIAYTEMDELVSLRELFGYFTDTVKIITDPTVVEYDRMSVGFVPWMTKKNQDQCIQFIEENRGKIHLLGGHFEMAGFNFSPGIVATKGMQNFQQLFRDYPLVVSGHYHTKSKKKNFIYLGSQFEFTWIDCDDPKFFHVLDTESGKFFAVRNPIKLFRKMVYSENFSKEELESVKDQFVKLYIDISKKTPTLDETVEVMMQNGAISVTGIEFVDEKTLSVSNKESELLNENFFPSTRSFIDDYIERYEPVRHGIDKGLLSAMMTEIYVEAEEQLNDNI